MSAEIPCSGSSGAGSRRNPKSGGTLPQNARNWLRRMVAILSEDVDDELLLADMLGLMDDHEAA